MSLAIRFEQVSKKYILNKQRPRSFQEIFVNLFRLRRQQGESLWVLKDVSFDIQAGESVALMGPNGAGKSTVLKLISQIVMPTAGQIEVEGRVSSLLELGAGFHPDLTGRENVYLNGALVGLSRAEIDRKYADIVEFSGMQAYMDLPVKHYSSGMYLRLAFSMAIHVEPDILLVDEAIAVGDDVFQKQCLKRIAELQARGVTFVLISHNMDMVRRYCQRGIWLQDGQIQADGDVERVSEAYLTALYTERHRKATKQTRALSAVNGVNRWGTGEIEIERVELLNGIGQPCTVFHTGEPFVIRMHYSAHRAVEEPVFGVALYRADGTHINGPNTKLAEYPLPVVQGRGYVDYAVEALNLLPGAYEASVAVYDSEAVQAYDHQHRLHRFQVLGGRVAETRGVVYFPSRWAHCPAERVEEAAQPMRAAVE